VIYNRGNHEITFGGDFQRIHNGEVNPAGQTGVIILRRRLLEPNYYAPLYHLDTANPMNFAK
jgi:hypothetical protein